jgi:hypothetical protein
MHQLVNILEKQTVDRSTQPQRFTERHGKREKARQPWIA